MNEDGSGDHRLTTNPARDWYPSWSPDGGRIVFETDRDGLQELYVVNADGSAPPTRITHTSGPGVSARMVAARRPDRVRRRTGDLGHPARWHWAQVRRRGPEPELGAERPRPVVLVPLLRRVPRGLLHGLPGRERRDRRVHRLQCGGSPRRSGGLAGRRCAPLQGAQRVTDLRRGQHRKPSDRKLGLRRLATAARQHPVAARTTDRRVARSTSRSCRPAQLHRPNRTHGPPLNFPSCAPPAQTSPNLTVRVPGGDNPASTAASCGWRCGSARPAAPTTPTCACARASRT